MNTKKLIDLTGMKFERLKVIKRANNHIQPNGNIVVMWECECECGNKVIVRGISLRKGITKSCGCLAKEKSAKRLKEQREKVNIYDLSKNYGVGYTSNTNEKFYFDIEDYDKIKDFCWIKGQNSRIVSHDKKTGKRITLNRLIMDIPEGMCVNYMNHNIYDNRKQNLEVVPYMKCQWGKTINKNNTSGTTGVILDKRTNKWCANIFIRGKYIYLGSYKNKSNAIKARKEAEEKYFGEYSYDNRMKGVENNE